MRFHGLKGRRVAESQGKEDIDAGKPQQRQVTGEKRMHEADDPRGPAEGEEKSIQENRLLGNPMKLITMNLL